MFQTPDNCTHLPCKIRLEIFYSKVIFKILQTRLQHYVNQELPGVESGFRKGRGTSDQIANICWIIEKAREFQKNIYLCFIDYTKTFDCVDHNKLWKIFKEVGIPDHLTCLMAESKEELKSLLMKVKEESIKVGLKFSIQKTKQ